MKAIILIVLMNLFLLSCNNHGEDLIPAKIDWGAREAVIPTSEDRVAGRSYLPVYSHIYHRFDHTSFNLTITVSIRNISTTDTLFLTAADYYNTAGEKIREYLQFPVYVSPLETIEIVINEDDTEGGSGANFMFDWIIKGGQDDPLFEAIMISTKGQQGLSFSTRGVRLTD
ncbi:MAG: DUF3124 domain-containing protein [Bacteroidales bacterium]|nr:DUF3124 domain-containing protein [Bacteroidales bacterium]